MFLNIFKAHFHAEISYDHILYFVRGDTNTMIIFSRNWRGPENLYFQHAAAVNHYAESKCWLTRKLHIWTYFGRLDLFFQHHNLFFFTTSESVFLKNVKFLGIFSKVCAVCSWITVLIRIHCDKLTEKLFS